MAETWNDVKLFSSDRALSRVLILMLMRERESELIAIETSRFMLLSGYFVSRVKASL